MKNSRTRIFVRLAVLTLLLQLCANTWAITNTKPIADANYIEAEKAYNRTEFINASAAANRALKYYMDGGYMDDVQKTNELIARIDEGLKKFGENFYKEGLRYYNNKEYDKAIENAEKAKAYYSEIKSATLEVQKCEQVISDANIAKMKGNIERANSVYTNAVKLFESKDYKNSRQLASEALVVYNQSNYQEGVIKCNALITEIDKRNQQTRASADVNDLKAQEAYQRLEKNPNFEDYKEVIKYAQEAKKLYAQIGYDPGYNHSVDLLNAANRIMYGMEEKLRLSADAKYNEGMNAYLLGRGSPEEKDKRNYFGNASKFYTTARDTYGELYNWAEDIANEEKRRFYETKLKDCNNRLTEIQQELDNINLAKKAEELYMDGYTLFTKGDCKNASTPVKDSKTLFNRVGDVTGVFKADTLIYQINDCLEKISEAETLLKNASRYYNGADYGNATAELEKAIKIYEKIKNQEGINKCSAFKQKISDSITAKKNADQILVQAQIDFRNNKFEDSLNGAESAKKMYTDINYTMGITNSTDLIKDSKNAQQKLVEQGNINMLLIMGAIVAAIILVVAGSWMHRMQKAKKEKEAMILEKKSLEESMKKQREEERLVEGARLRELEEERQKLKAMIAEEMKKIEVEKRGEEL